MYKGSIYLFFCDQFLGNCNEIDDTLKIAMKKTKCYRQKNHMKVLIEEFAWLPTQLRLMNKIIILLGTATVNALC